MDYNQDQVDSILNEVRAEAAAATQKYITEVLGGKDAYACGFAWVTIYDIRGNSKVGKRLKAAGVDQDHNRRFQIWNPSKSYFQNIDAKEKGAEAAAEVLRRYGFNAYSGSRLD